MKRSAGVLIFRRRSGRLELLLVHPGGPYWRKKDAGAWQLPKGAIGTDETPQDAAVREVQEELGLVLTAPLSPLGDLRQAGGKTVIAFAAEQEFDPGAIVSNTFSMEWPPRSGAWQSFPEVDAARWMTVDEARTAMLPSQLPFVDRLVSLLG